MMAIPKRRQGCLFGHMYVFFSFSYTILLLLTTYYLIRRRQWLRPAPRADDRDNPTMTGTHHCTMEHHKTTRARRKRETNGDRDSDKKRQTMAVMGDRHYGVSFY